MDIDEDLELPVSVKAAPSDGIGVLDFLLSLLLAAGTAGLMFFWAFPGIGPEMWDDVAVAAGVRPAASVVPGIWHFIASALFRNLGLNTGLDVLRMSGPVVSGLCAGMVFLLFRQILSLTSRLRLQYSPQRFLIVRLASFLGALFFACADPVWKAGQMFSPVILLVFLSAGAMLMFFSFLQGGRLASAYGAMFLLGVLSAESPMGIFLVVFCWGVYFLAVRNVLSLDMPLLNPFVGQITKWHMTFLFLLGLGITVTFNCLGFGWRGGASVVGLSNSNLLLAYCMKIWDMVGSAASPIGWAIALCIVVLPCGVAAGLLPRAVDEEQFLPYHIGSLFLVTSLVAYAQLAGLDPLWMWTWGNGLTMFGSQYLLCMFVLMSAATVTFGLVVLGVDSFCRNHRRLAVQMFAEIQMSDGDGQMLSSKRFLGTLRRIGLVVLPLVLSAGVIPGRRLAVPRQMCELLDEYVQETCDECGDARWLFTDGVFDVAVEIAAAMKGHALNAMSLAAGNDRRDIVLRTRGGVDAEDAFAMRSGAATVLRTWVRDKPDRLAASALQLGMDVWKREGRTPPPCSGVLCRPSGMDEAARLKGVEAARALARRMIEFRRGKGKRTSSAGVTINRLFVFAQWRLSRMMRLRSESEDAAGRAAEAIEESRLADELDGCNPSVKNIAENMEKMLQLSMTKMTPREGLQLALVRADFAMARKYAETILEADPSDANANFGMGMSYFVQEQWARAEDYLRRCLVRNPREPAVYNNLAVIQLKTGRCDTALRNVRKALGLAPDSVEIKDTLRQIEKALSAARSGGGEGKNEIK